MVYLVSYNNQVQNNLKHRRQGRITIYNNTDKERTSLLTKKYKETGT